MADTTTTPQPSEPSVYRPLSGLAVTGFGLALLFAAGVVVSFIVSLINGTAFYFPVWTFAIPAAAIVFGFLGQNQIRQSEGTRAGLKLARWAIGLSLVLGLMCATYSFVTELALRQQANAFLTEEGPEAGFFPRLMKARQTPTELDAAFLLTVAPSERAGAKPGKEEGLLRRFDALDDKMDLGELTKFRTHPLIMLFGLHDPEKIKIEPLGMQEWKYENLSYSVTRLYRITIPEGAVEASLQVMSREGAEGEQRKWFVTLPHPTSPKLTPTRYGEATLALDKLCRDFLKNKLTEQTQAGKPLGDFQKLDATDWNGAFLKDFDVKKTRERVADAIAAAELPMQISGQGIPLARKVKDRFQFIYTFKLTLPKLDANTPPLLAVGTLIVQTAEPFDPETAKASPNWELHKLSVQRIYPIIQRKKDSR